MSESTEILSIDDAIEAAKENPDVDPHPDFLNYVRTYPESNAGHSFRSAATYSSLGRFERGACGSFEKALWSGGKKEAENCASAANKTRLAEL